MLNNIYYCGKMTDMYPSWLWNTVYDYACEGPLNFIKVLDYLKERYGRKRAKMSFAEIEITKVDSEPKIIKPKLQVFRSDGVNSNNGKLYHFLIKGALEIAEDYYKTKDEGLIYVSECLSQVLERETTFSTKDNEEIMVFK